MKILALILSITSFNLYAQIKPFHISMEVGNGTIVVGETKLNLEKTGDLFQYKTVTQATGVFALFNKDEVVAVTTLKQTPERFYPTHYQYTNIKSNKTETEHFDFNYDKKQVEQHRRGKTTNTKLKEHAYDANSIVIGVMTWLQNNIENNITDNKSRSFQNHYHLQSWTKNYRIAKEETLDLPYGKVKAIKIIPDGPAAKRQANIWISPELGYIPVKIEQMRKGKLHVQMELRKIY